MGYSATFVVARAGVPLAHQDGVAAFGHRHRYLRDLGGGWQMLATSGHDDTALLVPATGDFAELTGAPVLTACLCDSDCTAIHTAIPGGPQSSAHLPDPAQPCLVYGHRPQPPARDPEDVAADLLAWAAAADLTPDADAVADVVGGDDGVAEDRFALLLNAFGLDGAAQPRPYAIPFDHWPLSGVESIARIARMRAMFRDADGDDAVEPEPWESESIALEDTLWASLYDDTADVQALTARVDRMVMVFEDRQRSAR